jgi:uncharacterized membrane protein YqjE
MLEMSEHGLPLLRRGKLLLEQLLKLAQTRLQLVGLELEEEKLALLRQLQLAILGGVCALLAGFTLILWLSLAFPQTRLIILGVIFVLFAAVSAFAFWSLRRAPAREPLFARVAEQFRLDREALHSDKGPRTTE